MTATIELASVELRRIGLPLVRPFRTSFGTQTDRDVLLVRVDTTDGVTGWGECVAGTEPTYSAESTAGAHQVLREHLVPRLLTARTTSAAEVCATFDDVVGHPMAKAAVELAVLDAELRTEGRPLAERLGATNTAVSVGVSVGITGNVDELVDVVAGYVADGYRRVKLKIEPGFDVEPVAAIRSGWPELLLQVDANTAYALSDSAHLARLDAFDLLLIEQPFREDDLLDHAELARRISTPVCLDEGITSAHVARQAVELGACSIVNIKPGRVGGLLEAKAIHDDCLAVGVPVWCGGMLETGIGRAANLALAALPGFTLPGDISATDRYWATDVTAPFVLGPDSTIQVPTGDGIGIDVDEDAVGALTTAVEEMRG